MSSNKFEKLQTDSNGRGWLKDQQLLFREEPIISHIWEAIGSVLGATNSINFTTIPKTHELIGSWSETGFDKDDWGRIEVLYSTNKNNKKGFSIKSRGIRCACEDLMINDFPLPVETDNFDIDINENSESDSPEIKSLKQKTCKIYSRNKNYESGDVYVCELKPLMYIKKSYKATDEEKKEFFNEMKEKHSLEESCAFGTLMKFKLCSKRFEELKNDEEKIKNQLRFLCNKNLITSATKTNAFNIGDSLNIKQTKQKSILTIVFNNVNIKPEKTFIDSFQGPRNILKLRMKWGNYKNGSQGLLMTYDTMNYLKKLNPTGEINGKLRNLDDITNTINLKEDGDFYDNKLDRLNFKPFKNKKGEDVIIEISVGSALQYNSAAYKSDGKPKSRKCGDINSIWGRPGTSSNKNGTCGVNIMINGFGSSLSCHRTQIKGLINHAYFSPSDTNIIEKQLPYAELDFTNYSIAEVTMLEADTVKLKSKLSRNFKFNTNKFRRVLRFVNNLFESHILLKSEDWYAEHDSAQTTPEIKKTITDIVTDGGGGLTIHNSDDSDSLPTPPESPSAVSPNRNSIFKQLRIRRPPTVVEDTSSDESNHDKSKKSRDNFKASTKRKTLKKQKNTCKGIHKVFVNPAINCGINAEELEDFFEHTDYICPLWQNNGTGKFIKSALGDMGGHICEFDHIKECREGGTNKINNCQVLCKTCHFIKTQIVKERLDTD